MRMSNERGREGKVGASRGARGDDDGKRSRSSSWGEEDVALI